MAITNRPYNIETDLSLVSQFLLDTYQQGGIYPNWEESAWQYMYSHRKTDPAQAHKIRIWEDDGKVVGVVSHDGSLGDAFFFEHPDYLFLKEEMFQYAEQNLYAQCTPRTVVTLARARCNGYGLGSVSPGP